jgi:aspartyl-tRNA(Asn)/glutamyl-tRNA(Gln) amidotransferase subunit A
MARTVEGCAAMTEALVPAFERVRLESLEDVSVGVTWLELADPLVRARVEGAGALLPHRRAVDFPLPAGVEPAFMREVAESHRGLFPEHADAYGENVRVKLERCLRVTDREARAAERARSEYREQAEAALDALDLLLTPTQAFVAPPADRDELDIRIAVVRPTLPFNALGWPALALPCGPAEDGLPASAQLVGRPGADALVLAAAAALEQALASLVRGTA